MWETTRCQAWIDLSSFLLYLRAPNKFCIMKPEIHPENYRLVVFKDMSNDYSFLSRSTANTKETVVWEDGNEYPLVKMDIHFHQWIFISIFPNHSLFRVRRWK